MEKGKILIPIISVLAIGAIIASVIIFNNRGKDFNLPSRSSIESDIVSLGYKAGTFDSTKYKDLGVTDVFYKVYISKDKNDDTPLEMNIGMNEYDNDKDAFKIFYDYYTSAQYLKKKDSVDGTVKLHYDEKAQKGYILYNVTLKADGLVDNYAFSSASGDLFNAKVKDYMYGGVYYDGKKVAIFTTTNVLKKDQIVELLEKYGLPH